MLLRILLVMTVCLPIVSAATDSPHMPVTDTVREPGFLVRTSESENFLRDAKAILGDQNFAISRRLTALLVLDY